MAFFPPQSFFPWMQCLLPSGFTPSRVFDDGVRDNPMVELLDRPLWEKFSEIGTEMVITKNGRRIFPAFRVKISGLNKNCKYYLLMDLVSPSSCRYKFLRGKWLQAGNADPELPPRPFFHPDSPATGEHWMGKGANFSKMKLTNNMTDNNGFMILNSMHKYLPRLHIMRCDDNSQPIYSTLKTFCFNETAFIAVTAYQNTQVTELKIEENPFAKGFRKDGNGKREKKRHREDETTEAENETVPLKKCFKSDDIEEEEEEEDSPRIPPELMAQWQLALFSTFGAPFFKKFDSMVTPAPSKLKKSGFDVLDLLSRP
uniref:T-box domain-containing protein n=2 Tax=Caenorhabditis japonica TaxID=281687 RepID=A0A8R1HQ87_CAEJA